MTNNSIPCCSNDNVTSEIMQISNETGSDRSEVINGVRIAIAVIHIAVCFFGLTGNGIILYTMIKVVKNHSVTDLYILNLAISDFFFVATLPFSATDMLTRNNWIFGIIGCKLFVSVNYLVLCAGVLIVTAMSFDRFQNVVFAVKMRGVRTTRRAKIIIYCLWGFSVLYMIPASIAADLRTSDNSTVHPTARCSLHYESIGTFPAQSIMTAHTVFRFVVAFLVPFVVMVICNLTIIHFLRKRRSKKQIWKAAPKKSGGSAKKHRDSKHSTADKKEDRITRLILLVTTVFLFCFLPNFILNSVYVFDALHLISMDHQQGDILLIFRWTSVCFLYVNSALNPFLYAYSGSGFRLRIKEALTRRVPIQRTTRRRIVGMESTTITQKANHMGRCSSDRIPVDEKNNGFQEGKQRCVAHNEKAGLLETNQNAKSENYVCYEDNSVKLSLAGNNHSKDASYHVEVYMNNVSGAVDCSVSQDNTAYF